MSIEKNIEEMIRRSKEKSCATCKHGRCKSAGDSIAVYCKHPQAVKADSGKPQLTLVPRQILFDIARVREYGTKKYGAPDNWKKVEIQRYRDAAFRHLCAYLDDPQGKDEESGLPHLAHLACNIAFLCELENKEKRNNETINISND